MTGYDVHLIGSIPLKDARAVFATVSRELGPRLPRLPDGETGERSHWLGWIEPVFSNHPAFEPTGQSSRVHANSDPRPHRIRRPFAQDIRFATCIADAAIDSPRFRRAEDAAQSSRCRAGEHANPVSVVHRFVVDEDQAVTVTAYEQAMLAEIGKLAASIPHDQLAIQFDIAQHVFKPLETGEANRFGQSREEMLTSYAAGAVRWGNAVPPRVELLYHLCYGDNAHRHAGRPSSLAVQIDFITRYMPASGARSSSFICQSRATATTTTICSLKRLKLRPEHALRQAHALY
jgi:hypothetical protein